MKHIVKSSDWSLVASVILIGVAACLIGVSQILLINRVSELEQTLKSKEATVSVKESKQEEPKVAEPVIAEPVTPAAATLETQSVEEPATEPAPEARPLVPVAPSSDVPLTQREISNAYMAARVTRDTDIAQKHLLDEYGFKDQVGIPEVDAHCHLDSLVASLACADHVVTSTYGNWRELDAKKSRGEL